MQSDDDSYDDYIGAPQVSEVEPLYEDRPRARPMPTEPTPQKSLEEAPYGAQSEEAPEEATPGRTIWEHNKTKGRFIRSLI